MRYSLILLILTILPQSKNAQTLTPESFGFKSYEIISDELGKVNYYLSNNTDESPKPLLVYLDGSGPYPLFQHIAEGVIGSTVVFDINKLEKEYRVLLISKPGVPFVDSVGSDSNGFPLYDEPQEYKDKLSLDWRVESAHQVINHLIINPKIDNSRVIVLGFSEGAQVGPSLAKTNKYLTHLLLFGGNGLNQFFDPIISARTRAATGQISELQAQSEIDSLFIRYRDIYNNPAQVNKKWWGHTLKRWASFTAHGPYKYLLDLNIPIYIANGSLDENSVLSADYIQLEFIKNQKSNLTYKTYPNFDHQFNEIIFKDGSFMEAIPKIDIILSDAFEWLEEFK